MTKNLTGTTSPRGRRWTAAAATMVAVTLVGTVSCGSDEPVQENTPVAPGITPPATDTRTTNAPTLSNLPVTSAP